jgi:hypothetical protein
VTPADPEALRRLLADTLLLDFDGSVCSVFAGFQAPAVVEQLCVVLSDGGYGELPPHVEKSEDPFDVLNYAAIPGDTEAHYVNATFAAHEADDMRAAQAAGTRAIGYATSRARKVCHLRSRTAYSNLLECSLYI